MRASDEKPLNQGATQLIKAKSDQPMPTAEWMAKFEKSPKLFLDAVKLWMNGAKLHREFVESINEVELRRKLPAGFESLTESIALFMEVNPRFDLKPLIEFSQVCVSIRDCHDSRDSWAQSELSEIADGQLSLSVGSDSKLIAHVQALFGRCEYHCNRLIRFASIQNELLSRENFEHQSAWNSEKPVAVWSAPYPMDAVSDKPIPTAQWMENFESQSQLLVDAIGEWQDGARYWHNYVADRTYGRESKGTPPVGFGPLTDALVMWSQTPGHGQISLKPLKEFMRLCCGAREIDARGGELRHVGIHLTDAELFERVCALSIECHHTCFDMNRQALLQCERAAKVRSPQSNEPMHSDDFRTVTVDKKNYNFTPTQAACVSVLWDAWERGTAEISGSTILEDNRVESNAERLRDIFRSRGKQHPAWGTLIREGETKGTFQLFFDWG